jgi:predicted lipoprotein with Yx(FWY)xxD motif
MIRPLHTATLTTALAALLFTAACATAAAPARTVNGSLVDAGGMTLYTFDKDTAGDGKSVCNGPCATLWPAFTAEPSAMADGGYSVITRDDGSKQWAYKGKALYRYSGDKKPGETTGDNFRDIWHVAHP